MSATAQRTDSAGRKNSPNKLEWELHHQLIELVHRIRLVIKEEAAKDDLSGLQANVIKVLSEEGPMPARAVAERLNLDTSNITGVIDRLEERGYVRREVDAEDRRVKPLMITALGRRTWKKLSANVLRRHPAITHMTVEEQAWLRSLLADILEGRTADGKSGTGS